MIDLLTENAAIERKFVVLFAVRMTHALIFALLGRKLIQTLKMLRRFLRFSIARTEA